MTPACARHRRGRGQDGRADRRLRHAGRAQPLAVGEAVIQLRAPLSLEHPPELFPPQPGLFTSPSAPPLWRAARMCVQTVPMTCLVGGCVPTARRTATRTLRGFSHTSLIRSVRISPNGPAARAGAGWRAPAEAGARRSAALPLSLPPARPPFAHGRRERMAGVELCRHVHTGAALRGVQHRAAPAELRREDGACIRATTRGD